MKILLTLLSLLSLQTCYSQQLPILELDSSRLINNYDSEISDYVNHFDEFIVYEDRSSWTRTHLKYVIGRKGEKWESYVFTVKYKGDRYFEQSKYKIKKRKSRINQNKVDSVLNQLDSSSFYLLNVDSLNSHEIVVNDTLTELLVITDGNSQVFTISTPSKTYTIHAYMVDSYQSRQYIDDRRIFIECRKLFLSLF